MSDRRSALHGANFHGQVHVQDAGLRGMIALRGDLSSADLQAVVSEVAGVWFPGVREARVDGPSGLCWMAPDELLILLPPDQVATAFSTIAKALDGTHHLAVDVSDARACFMLEGEGVLIREVLAKLTPADMAPNALPVGELRRTRLAQVPAAIWFSDENRAELVCFRSVAAYVFGLLTNAAQPGSEVDYFR
ncbi:MAG: sarcosine oxidase subunit gamma family protein [Paracoccaceae bacterium]|nr:sarcosine oxidase subunit gamma family protein [Paracoccaceae bacterium]